MRLQLLSAALGFVLSGALCEAAVAPPSEWGVAVLEVGWSPDARHEQLALRGCLELMGIPFLATTNVEEAARYPLVLTGGILQNTQLSPAQREALYAYVERGGVLLSSQVQGNQFFPLFGLAHAASRRTNFRVSFASWDEPALRYLNRPEERTVSLGDPKLYSETIWSTEYTPSSKTKVLARYANGAAALTVNAYGRGSAYALGLGFKETTLLPQLADSFEAARRWINGFEPSGDVFRLLLRGLYEANVHPFVLIHTVPEGKDTAVCLSHDVDAQPSFRNSLSFAQMEKAMGVRSTFFVTTKFFTDSADIGYYSPDRLGWIRQVKDLGFEVASHSVSHSLAFEEFPVGSPGLVPESYDPGHPTIFGEALVSKELLDRDLNQRTAGFRAGYLRYPSELLRVLEESGYSFDSSVSAQWVLTNFPYFGFRQRSVGSERSKIVVVPVTLDDSRGETQTHDFLTAETTEEALRIWTEVVRANAENNGTTCLLIHPTDATYKLETERRFIETIRGDNTWIGDVGTMARFWHQRALLRPQLRFTSGGSVEIVLNLKRSELPPGQSLVLEVRGSEPAPPVRDVAGEMIPVRMRTAEDKLVMLLLP